MLLTEYDERKTLTAERCYGERVGHARGVAETRAQYEDALAAKDAEIADKDTRIAQLEAQLATRPK